MASFIDLTGQRHGKWTVLEFVGSPQSKSLWRCRCDCGAVKVIRRSVLLKGIKRACNRCAMLANRHTGPSLKCWRLECRRPRLHDGSAYRINEFAR